jgi:hypothetical protein
MKTLYPTTERGFMHCQECKGLGESLAEMIGVWPRYEGCGWCNCTGEVTPKVRGLWLSYRRNLKRVKEN